MTLKRGVRGWSGELGITTNLDPLYMYLHEHMQTILQDDVREVVGSTLDALYASTTAPFLEITRDYTELMRVNMELRVRLRQLERECQEMREDAVYLSQLLVRKDRNIQALLNK